MKIVYLKAQIVEENAPTDTATWPWRFFLNWNSLLIRPLLMEPKNEEQFGFIYFFVLSSV